MFLKTITLSFCVALYFLQCQGGPPDDVQRNTIGRIVGDLYVPNTPLTYEEFLTIFNQVKQATNAAGELSSLVDLERSIAASTIKVKDAIACAQSIFGDDEATDLVERFCHENRSRIFGTIEFRQLVDIIHVVKQTMQKDLNIDTAVQIKDEIIKRMYPCGSYSDTVTTIIENLEF
ncbi:uncharacterized protein LOC126845458 [Adelges cooleyi]|uniref:uncharacterized protein LOC126845458 n=1 Tax=Adelges cooleyi TaxID=133065 RepID=UPI00218091D3|nr:uncharacterized protein LOC126845458 [Adelges cooleyi]